MVRYVDFLRCPLQARVPSTGVFASVSFAEVEEASSSAATSRIHLPGPDDIPGRRRTRRSGTSSRGDALAGDEVVVVVGDCTSRRRQVGTHTSTRTSPFTPRRNRFGPVGLPRSSNRWRGVVNCYCLSIWSRSSAGRLSRTFAPKRPSASATSSGTLARRSTASSALVTLLVIAW